MAKVRVARDHALALEGRATSGAKERGSGARGADIADAILVAVAGGRGGPAEFHRRTGVRVTTAELRAIAGLPRTMLHGGVTPEQRRAYKAELARAGKLKRTTLERRSARGRSAAPDSPSVRAVNGGLPGLGRRA